MGSPSRSPRSKTRRPRGRRRDGNAVVGAARNVRAGAELVRAAPGRNGLLKASVIGALTGLALAWLFGLSLLVLLVAGIVVAIVVRLSMVGHLFRPPVSAAFVRRLQPIAGENLYLRPLTGADARALTAALDQKVISELGWTDEHVSGYGEFMRHPYLLTQLGHLAICDRAGLQVLGEVSIVDVDERRGTGEMGVWLGAAGRGRGLGDELFRLAFDVYHQAGLQTIYCVISVTNVPVGRILPRVGATLLDQRPHQLPDGRLIDSLWYEHRQVPEP